jgi:hypothetical protein
MRMQSQEKSKEEEKIMWQVKQVTLYSDFISYFLVGDYDRDTIQQRTGSS